MRGEKVQAATLGTILLAETLTRLSVPFSILGFQDVIIPLVGFDERLDFIAQEAICSIAEEVGGVRPGGNNQPRYNDDGPCLLEAAGLLSQQSASERVLIVVSDGLPEGRHSGPDTLRAAIRMLREQKKELQLIALGLGPYTDHVNDFYPEAIANVPVEEFSVEISALLERALLSRS